MVVAAISAYQLHDREPSLLAHSRSSPVYVDSHSRCYWLSSHEILILKPVKDGFDASTVDVPSGTSAPLPDLSERLLGADSASIPSLSPNGQWLLTVQRVNGWYIPVVLSVDGSTRLTWPHDDPYKFFGLIPEDLPIWLRDNSHWLEFKSTDRGDRTWCIRHGIGEPDKDLGKWDLSDSIMGLDSRGSLVAYRVSVGMQTKHCLRSYDATTGALMSETVLPIRFDGSFDQILLSPNSDRIAFVSITGGDQVYPKWLVSRIQSLRKNRRPFKAALWICGVDGKDLHEVGCTVANVHPYRNDNLGNLKWLPDGKSLSFVLDGKLWVTPAD
jgi:hypothetical protein